MATEEINYRVDTKWNSDEWMVWAAPADLEQAKRDQLEVLNHEQARDARIVELRTVRTETVLHVDAASLDILGREEI